MNYFFVLSAPEGFDPEHTEYAYIGSELHTDVVAARKEAKAYSRDTGTRTYVAQLVTRYKPGSPERQDY